MSQLGDTEYYLSPKVLRDVCEGIKQYYASRAVSNMFFSNVLARLQKNKMYSMISRIELIKCVKTLVLKFPKWLTFVENEQGKILRVNRSFPFVEVLKNLS